MTAAFTYRRFAKNDAAVLLVDLRSGLCNVVGDFSPDDLYGPRKEILDGTWKLPEAVPAK